MFQLISSGFKLLIVLEKLSADYIFTNIFSDPKILRLSCLSRELWNFMEIYLINSNISCLNSFLIQYSSWPSIYLWLRMRTCSAAIININHPPVTCITLIHEMPSKKYFLILIEIFWDKMFAVNTIPVSK